MRGGMYDKVNSYPSHICRLSYKTWNVQSGFGHEQEQEMISRNHPIPLDHVLAHTKARRILRERTLLADG
jgi:hypothetical protein